MRRIVIKRSPLIALFALVVVAAACAPGESELAKDDADAWLPSYSTAAEQAALTANAGGPCSTGSAEVRFGAEGDAFGFAILARAGDALSAHTEGEPDLDTLLLLYGPADGDGFYGSVPKVAADDDGDGRLSRFTDYTVPRDGVYLLVTTTWQGRYRGDVTLRVAVDGEPGCLAAFPAASCDDADPCTTEVMTDRGCELVRLEACWSEPPLVCCLFLDDASAEEQRAWLPAPDCAADGGATGAYGECLGSLADPICCVAPEGSGEAAGHAIGWLTEPDCEEEGGVRGGNAICLVEQGTGRTQEAVDCCNVGGAISNSMTRQECVAAGGSFIKCTGYRPAGSDWGPEA